MPVMGLEKETVTRLDGLRIDDESSDEIAAELITIHEAEELGVFRAGNEI